MYRKGLVGLVSAVALLASSSGAWAQDALQDLKDQLEALQKQVEELERKQAQTPTVKKEEPAPAIATPKGFEMNIRGRVEVDFGMVSDGNNTMDVDAAEFRAAWFGVEGKSARNVKYKFEADFGSNKVSMKDAYVQYSGGGFKTTVGHAKMPISMEFQTSGTQLHFLERSSFMEAFGVGRGLGIGVGTGGDNWGFNTGVFRGGAGTALADEGLTFAARLNYGGKLDNGAWSVGVSMRSRDGGDATQRYRARPHNHLSKLRFVDTGSLTAKDFMYGAEAAVQFGSFHLGGEYMGLSAKDANTDGSNAKFFGAYVEAGWWLTGENSALSIKKGAWGRPKVNNPFLKGGMGAWQILAKWDFIDLSDDDSGLWGGEQITYILGVNWHLNRYSRIVLNYNHSEISGNEGLGGDWTNDADGIGLRFQVDW